MATFQILKTFVSWKNDFDTAIQTLPTIIVGAVSFVKFGNAILHQDKMIMLLTRIKRDYEMLMALPEREIMREYAMASRKITIYYATFITTFASLFALMPFTPVFMDLLKPLNETRKRKFIYEAEYMVDEEKYYLPIMMHELVGSFIAIDILIAVDAMFMVYVQHACGLLAVVSHRMKRMHVINWGSVEREKVNCEYNEIEDAEMYRNFKWTIKIHKDILMYSNLLESSFTASIAIQVLLNIICISMTGIQLVININNTDDVMKYGSFLAGQLDHLFFLCLPGQRLLNYSERMFIHASTAPWYAVSNKVQTLYRLVLLRSSVPCKLTAGKITILSMETFLGVTQTAVSYFTVLSSMR